MKNDKLNGKVAVVTGASKGIGAGIAKEFAEAGASIVVNYASDKQGADRVVDEITKRGGKAIAIQGNVAKKATLPRRQRRVNPDKQRHHEIKNQDLARRRRFRGGGRGCDRSGRCADRGGRPSPDEWLHIRSRDRACAAARD